jgi:VanZ family protein
MHLRTTAWPLFLLYVSLVVYASLFPFAGWRDQSNDWWLMLSAPWPRYWTGFDVLTNLAGYVPLGFFLALTLLRSVAPARPGMALLTAALAGSALSLLMETVQQFLPARVPSNLDWLLNSAGALLGAALAVWLEWMGWVARWARFRSRWFPQAAAGTLALLLAWPLALLFPAPVPLALGQLLERLRRTLEGALADTVWMDWLWEGADVAHKLAPGTEMLLVAMGLLTPVLLAYSAVTVWPRRLMALAVLVVLAVVTTALSTLLSFGPVHVWVWLSESVRAGLVLGVCGGLLLSGLSVRACLSLSMVSVVLALSLVNQAPTDAYFAQTLVAWEQGRFARFHGLAQWLGWLWPCAALVHAFVRLTRRDAGRLS